MIATAIRDLAPSLSGGKSVKKTKGLSRFLVLLPVIGLLGALLLVPRHAQAGSSNSFFGTIGISVAVGTVLGASTLPFYDDPGSHVKNLAIGAAAGASVGIGILIYGLFQGSSPDEAGDGFSFRPEHPGHSRNRVATRSGSALQGAIQPRLALLNSPSGPAVLPMVSLTW